MCWSREVSLVTFVVAIVGIIYLYNRNKPNDRWVAVFAAVVAMIQLAEFFMWSDLSCGRLNMYASMFALLVLACEPLMNMIGGIHFSNSPYKKVLKWMLVAYIIFIIYTYLTQIRGKHVSWCGTKSCQTGGCNLHWNFMDGINGKLGIIWILFLLVPFLTMTPHMQGIILFALGFITFGMAAFTNSAALGSLWCWLAIFVIYSKIIIG